MTSAAARPGPRHLLWLVVLAVGLPLAVVFALAVHAILGAHHTDLERERNHLLFLALLRARELDRLPALAATVLDARQPIVHLPLDPPPRAGERPLLRRFFVRSADHVALLPRLPYLPDAARESVPVLVHLSSPEAFAPPDESRRAVSEPAHIESWVERLQDAEELLDRGQARAALAALETLAADTPISFFRCWVRWRWAAVAESAGAAPPAEVDRVLDEIAAGDFRELIPDQPLRLLVAHRTACRRFEAHGDGAVLLEFLASLLGGALGNECSRSAYESLLADVTGRLTAAGVALPEEIARLRAEVEENIFLAETVLPALPRPGRQVAFAAHRLPRGQQVLLAFRSGRPADFGADWLEGGIVDLRSPELPLASSAEAAASGDVRFAVVDAEGASLWGAPLPAPGALRAAVAGGPGERFRVAAFHADASGFVSARRQRLVLLLAVVSALALAAVGGGLLAHRGLRRELELARLKSEFVAGVSHELRTPLTTIQMFGETLALGRVRDAAHLKRYYDAINAEALRLRRLIDDLLDFGRMEAGRVVLLPAATDPVAVARGALEAFARTPLGARRKVVFAAAGAEGTTALLDGHAVERALLNLLLNAARYSAPDSPIRLTVAVGGRRLEFAVEDRGIGIPRRYHRRVFEKFFRVPGVAEREPGGTGLGLALVRQIVTSHGGTVSLRSVPGQGSRFTLVFPLRPPEGIDSAGRTAKI
ncbi:MAG: HAMP domain-containing histidine kinase [Planctomycetes bacterium]|nr:HAMP domain-containing histidine kinase [Planctomycetota bacterium]